MRIKRSKVTAEGSGKDAAVRFSSEDIHRQLFGARAPEKARGLDDLKKGIRDYIRKRYARG